MVRKRLDCQCGIVFAALVTCGLLSQCISQDALKLENNLSQDLRNRSDVRLILQKLSFLRSNDINLGENHPTKKSTQLQIRDCESDLQGILELNGQTDTDHSTTVTSVDVQDSLSPELRLRDDVQSIVQQLRFLKLNDKKLGPNHPNKESTQLQIRELESALRTVKELNELPSLRSDTTELATSLEASATRNTRNRENAKQMAQTILFLRVIASSFKENHPNWKSIQERIQSHQASLKALAKNSLSASEMLDESRTLEFQERRDVRVIVQKLAYLRSYETNFGENHPNWKTIQTEIRGYEASLAEMVVSKMRFRNRE